MFTNGLFYRYKKYCICFPCFDIISILYFHRFFNVQMKKGFSPKIFIGRQLTVMIKSDLDIFFLASVFVVLNEKGIHTHGTHSCFIKL